MSQLLQFYKSFQRRNQAPAPTFEDLTVDENLTEIQRIVHYVQCSIGLRRLVHVKMLGEVAISVGFDKTLATIIPLLPALSRDSEQVVKQHLAEQLTIIATFFFTKGGHEGYRAVIDNLLSVVAVLLEDDKLEVRQSASQTLVEIASYLENEDIGQHILTIVLKLAHEDDKEEIRMTASQLFNLLAEHLGR